MDMVVPLHILSTERASSAHSANIYFYTHVKTAVLVVFGVTLFFFLLPLFSQTSLKKPFVTKKTFLA